VIEFRLEMVTVPVSDVDRAKSFYVDRLGFSVEQDVQIDEHHRFVELVPTGSPCAIALTTGYVDSEPGSLRGAQLNVDDAYAAREFLVSHGVQGSEVQQYPWGRFCFFSDPDGNEWSVHEVSSPGGSPPT
jgi:catechol 2,3-dioxygenase-like lactoylglutathione lyase family enzyme